MLEDDFIESLKEGDEEAFIEFVNLYKSKIISLCYSYTEDVHEAEDMSQEVFIAVYKNIKTFRKESSLSTYLYRISINKCLSYKRKGSFKSILLNFFIEEKAVEQDMELKTYVRQEIKKLSKDLKTPLVLYYYVGLSYKEISEVLETTERTIEGRIYRAKKILKEKFKGEEALLWKENRIF